MHRHAAVLTRGNDVKQDMGCAGVLHGDTSHYGRTTVSKSDGDVEGTIGGRAMTREAKRLLLYLYTPGFRCFVADIFIMAGMVVRQHVSSWVGGEERKKHASGAQTEE